MEQPLPAWLSYTTFTNQDQSLTTGVVQLPLTYYGPFIPLSWPWVFSGADLIQVSLLGGTGFQTISGYVIVVASPAQTSVTVTDAMGASTLSPAFISQGPDGLATLAAVTSFVDGSPVVVPLAPPTLTTFLPPGRTASITALISEEAGITYLVPVAPAATRTAAALPTVGPGTMPTQASQGNSNSNQGGPDNVSDIPNDGVAQEIPASQDGASPITRFGPIATFPPYLLSSSVSVGIYTIPGVFTTFPNGDSAVVFPQPSPTSVFTGGGASATTLTGTIVTLSDGSLSTSFSVPTPFPSVSPTASSSSFAVPAKHPSHGSSLSAGSISGIVVGAVVAAVLLLLALLAIFCYRRRTRWHREPPFQIIAGEDPEVVQVCFDSVSATTASARRSGSAPSRISPPLGAFPLPTASSHGSTLAAGSGSTRMSIPEADLFFTPREQSRQILAEDEVTTVHSTSPELYSSEPTQRASDNITRGSTSSPFGTSVATNNRLSEFGFGTVQVHPPPEGNAAPDATLPGSLGLNIAGLFTGSVWRNSKDSKAGILGRRDSAGWDSIATERSELTYGNRAGRLEAQHEEEDGLSTERASLLQKRRGSEQSSRTFGGRSSEWASFGSKSSNRSSRRGGNTSAESASSRRDPLSQEALPPLLESRTLFG